MPHRPCARTTSRISLRRSTGSLPLRQLRPDIPTGPRSRRMARRRRGRRAWRARGPRAVAVTISTRCSTKPNSTHGRCPDTRMRTSLKPKPPRRGRPAGGFTQHKRLMHMQSVLENHPEGLVLADLAGAMRVTTRSVRRYLHELDKSTKLEPVETRPGGALVWRIKPTERGRAVLLRRTQAYGLLAVRRAFEVMRGS